MFVFSSFVAQCDDKRPVMITKICYDSYHYSATAVVLGLSSANLLSEGPESVDLDKPSEKPARCRNTPWPRYSAPGYVKLGDFDPPSGSYKVPRRTHRLHQQDVRITI